MSRISKEDKLQKYEEVLLAPYTYMLEAPAERVRTKILSAFNDWLQVPEEKLIAVQDIGEMINNFSLLYDDMEDNSMTRRGQPASHMIYSAALTLNSASYMTFVALRKILDLEHPLAVSLYYEHMVSLHRGQGVEIYWRCNHYVPTDEEYEEMAVAKYGHLFMYLVNTMQLFSKNKTDYSTLLEKLGVYFSIRNDYSNLRTSGESKSSNPGSDISQGIFTFPISHACRVQQTDNRVLKIMRQRTTNPDVISYCISLIDQYGSLQYTRDKLSKLDMEIRGLIAQFGGNTLLTSILDDLLCWREDN